MFSKPYVNIPFNVTAGKNDYFCSDSNDKKQTFNLTQPHTLANEHVSEFSRVVLSVFLWVGNVLT